MGWGREGPRPPSTVSSGLCRGLTDSRPPAQLPGLGPAAAAEAAPSQVRGGSRGWECSAGWAAAGFPCPSCPRPGASRVPAFCWLFCRLVGFRLEPCLLRGQARTPGGAGRRHPGPFHRPAVPSGALGCGGPVGRRGRPWAEQTPPCQRAAELGGREGRAWDPCWAPGRARRTPPPLSSSGERSQATGLAVLVANSGFIDAILRP